MKADEVSTTNWSILICLNHKVKTEAFQSTLLQERANRYSAPSYNKIFQRNYYEHIIRNQRDYHRIEKYIIDNPRKQPIHFT